VQRVDADPRSGAQAQLAVLKVTMAQAAQGP